MNKNETSNEQLISSIQDGRPLVLIIKNTTDEKLYDVNLFNHDYDKQDKIDYSCGIVNVEYAEILRLIDSAWLERSIKTIYMVSTSDKPNCAIEQVSAAITEMHKDVNGKEEKNKFYLDTDPQQQQAVGKKDVDIKNIDNLQLQIEYLMPQTKVLFYLYL